MKKDSIKPYYDVEAPDKSIRPIVAVMPVVLSIGWILLIIPLVDPPSIYAMNAFYSAITAAMIVSLVGAVILAWLIYQIIDRRTFHFRRIDHFLESIRSTRVEKDDPIITAIDDARDHIRQDVNVDKNAILWMVILIGTSLIGGMISLLVLFYILYFVNKDFHIHTHYERSILEVIDKTLRDEGSDGLDGIQDMSYPKHSAIKYVILSIVTFGIFTIYWLYVTIKDGNTHFDTHKKAEASLKQHFQIS